MEVPVFDITLKTWWICVQVGVEARSSSEAPGREFQRQMLWETLAKLYSQYNHIRVSLGTRTQQLRLCRTEMKRTQWVTQWCQWRNPSPPELALTTNRNETNSILTDGFLKCMHKRTKAVMYRMKAGSSSVWTASRKSSIKCPSCSTQSHRRSLKYRPPTQENWLHQYSWPTCSQPLCSLSPTAHLLESHWLTRSKT